MTSTNDAGELPEWINLGALTTPEEVAQRETLTIAGKQLLSSLSAWIRDAAPLAERPPLLEVVDATRDQIYSHMGIPALAETVDRFRQLIAIFDASGSELDNRLNELHPDRVSDAQAETPKVADDLLESGPDELGVSDQNRPVSAVVDEQKGRWRNRSNPTD